MAKNLGLADRVNFVGRVESVKLEKLYAEAEMVIVPSITPESFGLVGLEAMSFAKPVVAANVGGISMWLQHNENGLLFSSGNSEELTQAIIKLHREPELRENMGKKGQMILREKFRPQQHLQKIIQLFHKLVEN
jgi:glycosyltransferase involved in cell wall biosynthesis